MVTFDVFVVMPLLPLLVEPPVAQYTLPVPSVVNTSPALPPRIVRLLASPKLAPSVMFSVVRFATFATIVLPVIVSVAVMLPVVVVPLASMT